MYSLIHRQLVQHSSALGWCLPVFRGMLFGIGAMAIHESAHIFTALGLGLRVKKIGLKVTKGLYTVREAGPVHKNLLIALAGPAINVLLIGTWQFSPTFGLANLCCAAANLLPIEGSDGRRVVACVHQLCKEATR